MFLIVYLLYLQVSGELVIVAKRNIPFVNEGTTHLSTPLQLPQFLLKVAAYLGGRNSTPWSEITVINHQK